MKVLLTHRYYWPDTPPYAYILREIAEDLAKTHNVQIFSTMPSYSEGVKTPALRRETINGIDVMRMRVLPESKRNLMMRVINSLMYCLCLFWLVIRQKPDIVMAATFPPVLAGWSASFAAKLVGAKFVYHMQDIHPEVSMLQGGRMGKSPFAAVFRWLDNQTLRRADKIIVLSNDMKNTLVNRGLNIGQKIHLINNFLFESFETAPVTLPPALEKPEGKTRVVFAGNMGRFQNLVPFIAAATLLEHKLPNLEFLFLGAGEAVNRLKQTAGNAGNIFFVDAVPYPIAKHVIANSDLGVVSLAHGITSVSYPSKTSVYLGLGLPLLTFVEKKSDLAEDVAQANLGLNIDSNDPEAISRELHLFLKDFSKKNHAAHVSAYFNKELQTPELLRKWRSVISFE